jgi:hypothetical protein
MTDPTTSTGSHFPPPPPPLSVDLLTLLPTRSVNAIAFNNLNTFCTAGSDGVLTYWDKDSR